jgi:hypothetical protein
MLLLEASHRNDHFGGVGPFRLGRGRNEARHCPAMAGDDERLPRLDALQELGRCVLAW